MEQKQFVEIERKFLIKQFPPLSPIRTAQVEQGYLSTDPVVRIRRSQEEGKPAHFRLCFKGKGKLVRREVELEISSEVYAQLCEMLPMPLVRKDFRVYRLEDGNELECSLVDKGCETSFYYAEIEFSDISSAQAFQPPAFLGEDITEKEGYTMSDYWKKKLKAWKEKEKNNA